MSHYVGRCDDPFRFLAACGFEVTRREDGLFNVEGNGTGLTAAELFDFWLRIRAWPISVPRAMTFSPLEIGPTSDLK